MLHILLTALNTITDSIIACKLLSYLDLSVNNLEKLPDAITSLIGLEELYLNDTFLDFLPANFGRLINLRILELRDNNLITLPKSMARLQKLQRIDIGNNEFKELPEVMENLINLTEFWCDGNRIRRINCNLAKLEQMIHFDASNNLLQYVPGDIGKWLKCQEFCVSSNELEELPFTIGLMKSLVALKLDENQLQELPESICQLENLEEIMVSHNDLFKLPSTMGLLRQLRFLTADENLLRCLPNEICSCSNLTILSVRGNKLTKVPPDIGRLTQLRVINVVNNFLTQLPVTILNLRQLSALWISDNQSQPLMPLQKEFNEISQSYFLTCYLLPQVVPNSDQSSRNDDNNDTSNRSPHNIQLHNSNGPSNTNAIAGKRRICFASDPVQEVMTIEQTGRLMRSPTPYPKELRVMSKFAGKNGSNGQQPQPQQQQQNPKKMGQQMINQSMHSKDLNNVNAELPIVNSHSFDDSLNGNRQDDLNMHLTTINDRNHLGNGYINDCQELTLKPKSLEIKEARITATAIDLPPLQSDQSDFHTEIYPDSTSIRSSKSNGSFMPAIPQDEVGLLSRSYQPYGQIVDHHDIPDGVNHSIKLLSNNFEQFDPNIANVNNNKKYIPQIQNSNLNNLKHISGHHSPNITSDEKPNVIRDESPYELRHNHTINGERANLISNNYYTNKIPPINYEQIAQPYQIITTAPKVYYSSSNGEPNEVNDNRSIDTNHDDYILNSTVETSSTPLIQQTSQQQQLPPPYHIAKAFTKKSKQDLMTYDMYRSNYQQVQNQSVDAASEQDYQPTSKISSPTPGIDSNSNGNDSQKNFDDEILEQNHNANKQAQDNGYQTGKSTAPSTWLFGLHKTPTVVSFK